MMDRASWEFTDLRARMNSLEGREELDANDILRPHVLARLVTSSWLSAPLSLDAWRTLQPVLHEELAHFAEEAYHETNRWLLQRKVLPETDLRPFIRRTRDSGRADLGGGRRVVGPGPGRVRRRLPGSASRPARPTRPSRRAPTDAPTEVGDETRMMTRAGGLQRGPDPAEAVLNRLNRLVGRQLPDFGDTPRQVAPASPRLSAAISAGAARHRPPPRHVEQRRHDRPGQHARSCSRNCSSASPR